MENVILMMPRPSDCYHCHFVIRNENENFVCPWTKEELSGHDLNIESSKDCPFQTEPDRKNSRLIYMDKTKDESDKKDDIAFTTGWNCCLEKLEKNFGCPNPDMPS